MLPVGDYRRHLYKRCWVPRPIVTISRGIYALGMFALTLAPLVFAQDQDSVAAEQASLGMSRRINHVFNYLNMAGTLKASEFQPLTQDQRTRIYVNTMVSPLGYLKAGFSAGIDQLKDSPS